MSALLRPQMSAGFPAKMEPMIVPIRAIATVKPRRFSSSRKLVLRGPVVPEMTAVSKPKRKPPRAATIALPIRAGVSETRAGGDVASFTAVRFSWKFTGGPPKGHSREISLICEVGWRAPELLALRQQVPEHFANGEDRMPHDLDSPALPLWAEHSTN